MGKLKDLAMVKSTNADNFAYLPPDAAFDALRILVKLDSAYSAGAGTELQTGVLEAVLRGLRRASPMGRIVIVEDMDSDPMGDKSNLMALVDKEMRLTNVDNLLMDDYVNQLAEPFYYASMTAPEYIGEYNCVIFVGALMRNSEGKAQLSGALKNLAGIFPTKPYREQFQDAVFEDLLKDVYFTIGHHVHGAVIDLSENYANSAVDNPIGKVAWADDLLALDEVVHQMVEEPVPAYVDAIRKMKKTLT